jgi:hypothetical protein
MIISPLERRMGSHANKYKYFTDSSACAPHTVGRGLDAQAKRGFVISS